VIGYKSTANSEPENQYTNSDYSQKIPMNKCVSHGIVVLVIMAALAVLPVSAIVYPPPTTSSTGLNATIPDNSDVIATMAAKHFVSATVSSGSPAVGEPVTIGGRVTGGVLSEGVHIWVFAGNYVNVSHVPVNANGTFSRTFPTTGLPLATYYVYIQSPGANGMFNIDLEDKGIFAGQVVNTVTNALIFNFTGTESVQDEAASRALSDAINNQGVDDAYIKFTFQLVPHGTTPIAAETSDVSYPAAATTKSPLPFAITGLALVIAGLSAMLYVRKRV
jgi:hypothetical protein